MSAQRYTSPVALERMAAGNCPECGEPVSRHDGWGGPGCSLTDNGAAARIAQYRADHAESYRRQVHRSCGDPTCNDLAEQPALETAREMAAMYAHRPEDVEWDAELNPAMIRSGWVLYLPYDPEGDCVRVVKRELDKVEG